MRAVAFERQDRVHHVLKYSRTCDIAVLGHLSDEYDRHTRPFRGLREHGRARFHLPDATRFTALIRTSRLYRVHNNQVGQ